MGFNQQAVISFSLARIDRSGLGGTAAGWLTHVSRKGWLNWLMEGAIGVSGSSHCLCRSTKRVQWGARTRLEMSTLEYANTTAGSLMVVDLNIDG